VPIGPTNSKARKELLSTLGEEGVTVEQQLFLEEVRVMMKNARDSITLAYAIIVVVGCVVNAAVCGAGGCVKTKKEEKDIDDTVLRLQGNDTKVERSQATTAVEAVQMHRRQQAMAGGFRIRLHWEKGYNWQNTPDEKYWCMECRGNTCISGTTVRINKCSSSSIHQKFIAIGKTIRPVSNPNLCFTVTGYDGKDTPIKLRTCNNTGSGSSKQNFIQLQSSTKFELHPQERQNKYCLSQHHHPKAKEVIYPEQCDKTRATDTTYWRVY